ncbi:hypothetical protein TNCV_2283521 [Trichonephila clavipes]|nr:hypothetical protein TNCV_2283521 [Trichonephila clavipes]
MEFAEERKAINLFSTDENIIATEFLTKLPCDADGSKKRMEDSERWYAVGRIEARQSITDVALFFDVYHSVI